MEEVWENIVGYEGFYQVSNLGRVKSLERIARNRHGYRPIRERILRTSDKGDYPIVGLHSSNGGVTFPVHRLVAQAFIPNPENKPCVNHIDGSRNNNIVSNLEWCTYSENNQHAFDLGLSSKGSSHCRAKLSDEQVLQISSLLDDQKHTQVEISRMFNVIPQIIYDIRSGNTWSHLTNRKSSPGGRYKKVK